MFASMQCPSHSGPECPLCKGKGIIVFDSIEEAITYQNHPSWLRESPPPTPHPTATMAMLELEMKDRLDAQYRRLIEGAALLIEALPLLPKTDAGLQMRDKIAAYLEVK